MSSLVMLLNFYMRDLPPEKSAYILEMSNGKKNAFKRVFYSENAA
jgi:hypothetical protein